MSDDDPSRRSVLRSTAVGASGLALGGLASTGAAARPAACDGTTETTTRTGSLSGADDADAVTYDASTSDPCEVAFDLASADATDFDLYVTYDGRTPSTTDFDARSKTSLTSGERVTVDSENVDANATFGVLVDAYTNGGSWTLEITETSTQDGGGGNEAPTASFTASATTVPVGESVEVDASAASDPDGSIASYDWTFGNGTGADGATASTAYDAAGEYEVALTVTDDDDATDTATRTVTVESGGGGDCDVTRTRTEDGVLSGTGDGDTYQYAARTADPCEVTLSLSADAGTDFDLYVTYDGRTPTPSDYDVRSYNYGSDEEVVVDGSTFGAADVLGVLVDSYDGSGAYTLVLQEVGTGDGDAPDPNDPPNASVAVDAATVGVGEPVNVDASASSDADGSIASYDWTFGDGTTAGGETASHAYDAVGEYALTLTVTDDDGATDTATRTVTVESTGGGDCGATRETAGTQGGFWWYGGSDDYTYDTGTTDPCEVTVTLVGPSSSDFDLYVTLDGRTPTTADYDARSASANAQEAIATGSVDASTTMGILVVAASGSGSYRLDVEELGR